MSLGRCTFPVEDVHWNKRPELTAIIPNAWFPCGVNADRLTEHGLRCPEHLRRRLTPLALEARWLLERAEAVEETYRGVGPVSARDVAAMLKVDWDDA